MGEMMLRVPVTIKSKVTETLKTRIVNDLKEKLEMVTRDLEQFEFQVNRLLSEQAKADMTQLTALRAQVEQEKQQRINFKTETAAQLKDAEALQIGSEITGGTMERAITVKVGDDLDKIMGMEILIEDGKILEFRG